MYVISSNTWNLLLFFSLIDDNQVVKRHKPDSDVELMEPGQTALPLDKRYNYRNYEMPTPLGVRGQTKLTDRNLSGPSVTFQQMVI